MLYLVDDCVIVCVGGWNGFICNCFKKWFGLLACSSLSTLASPPPTICSFSVSFWMVVSSFGWTSWQGHQTWRCVRRINTNNPFKKLTQHGLPQLPALLELGWWDGSSSTRYKWLFACYIPISKSNQFFVILWALVWMNWPILFLNLPARFVFVKSLPSRLLFGQIHIV